MYKANDLDRLPQAIQLRLTTCRTYSAHLCCSVDFQGQARLGGLLVRLSTGLSWPNQTFWMTWLMWHIYWLITSEKSQVVLCIYIQPQIWREVCELSPLRALNNNDFTYPSHGWLVLRC